MLAARSCLTLCDSMDCSPPGSLSVEFSRQEHWSGWPFPSPMITYLHLSYFPWLTLLAFKNQNHKQKLMMIYLQERLKEQVSHGPWTSFSRSIHAWSTHNNIGIRTWLILSTPRRSTFKNADSYLLNIEWEHTHDRTVHTHCMSAHTYDSECSCLPLSRDNPKARVSSPFLCPRDIKNV